MTIISENLWATEFEWSMPEGMTYHEFAKLRDKRWAKDDITQARHALRVFGELNKRELDDDSRSMLYAEVEAEKGIIRKSLNVLQS